VAGSDLFVTNGLNGTVGEYTTSGATVNASLISGLSQPYGIAVVEPPASKLALAQEPASTTTNSTLAPITVDVEDSSGDLVSSDNSDVTLAIGTGTTGATLGGTTTVAAVGGVATFNNLTLNAPGTYTLAATDGSLTSATSSPFNVTAVSIHPSTVTLGATAGSIVAGNQVTFTATVSGSGATPAGTVTFTDDGNTLGSVSLGGDVAQLSISSLPVGADSIGALRRRAARNGLTA
jgi:hypothetical protein